MKMEITQQKENPLMKRTEVYFVIDHAGESTPGRNAVAEEVAKQICDVVHDHLFVFLCKIPVVALLPAPVAVQPYAAWHIVEKLTGSSGFACTHRA